MSLFALYAGMMGYILAADLTPAPATFHERFGHWTSQTVLIWTPTSMIASYPYSHMNSGNTSNGRTR